VVSGKGRNKLIPTGGYSISDYIQTDASINREQRRPALRHRRQSHRHEHADQRLECGLGFAIPSNMAKEIGNELIAGHKIMRPWLGIRIETLGDDPSIRDLFKGLDKGVVVATIEADAPASKSDLRPSTSLLRSTERRWPAIPSFNTKFFKKKIGQSTS